jgi:ubiquitin C-terminal hydrolase
MNVEIPCAKRLKASNSSYDFDEAAAADNDDNEDNDVFAPKDDEDQHDTAAVLRPLISLEVVSNNSNNLQQQQQESVVMVVVSADKVVNRKRSFNSENEEPLPVVNNLNRRKVMPTQKSIESVIININRAPCPIETKSVNVTPGLVELKSENRKSVLLESLNAPVKTVRTTAAAAAALAAPITQTTNLRSRAKSFACLRNLGSTCYINCIVQVMRYTPGFVASIHRLSRQIDHLASSNSELEVELSSNKDIVFVRNLHELLIEMSNLERGVVVVNQRGGSSSSSSNSSSSSSRAVVQNAKISKFVAAIWSTLTFWSDGSQQDAHEFLLYSIHFINETDILLRRMEHKYQLKSSQSQSQSQRANTNCKASVVRSSVKVNFASAAATKTKCQSQEIFFSAPTTTTTTTTANTRSSTRLLKSTETTTTTTTTTAPLIISTHNSTSFSQSKSKSIMKIKSLDSFLTSDSPEQQQQQLMLLTPTKGGASSFNFQMLDPLIINEPDIDAAAAATSAAAAAAAVAASAAAASSFKDDNHQSPIPKVRLQMMANSNYKLIK